MSRLNTIWQASVDKTLCGMLQHAESTTKVNLDSIPCNRCSDCYLRASNVSAFKVWESIDVQNR
ncbi:hypothetical protein VPHD98A_0072 [Vibrio phage D98a]